MTIWTPTLPSNRPAYQALADAIAADQESGALLARARLPPHRALAHALGVTVGTVAMARRRAESLCGAKSAAAPMC